MQSALIFKTYSVIQQTAKLKKNSQLFSKYYSYWLKWLTISRIKWLKDLIKHPTIYWLEMKGAPNGKFFGELINLIVYICTKHNVCLFLLVSSAWFSFWLFQTSDLLMKDGGSWCLHLIFKAFTGSYSEKIAYQTWCNEMRLLASSFTLSELCYVFLLVIQNEWFTHER